MFNSCFTFIITVTTCFQNIVETNNITLNISVRILYTIPDSSLCCQINYDMWMIARKYPIHYITISY